MSENSEDELPLGPSFLDKYSSDQNNKDVAARSALEALRAARQGGQARVQQLAREASTGGSALVEVDEEEEARLRAAERDFIEGDLDEDDAQYVWNDGDDDTVDARKVALERQRRAKLAERRAERKRKKMEEAGPEADRLGKLFRQGDADDREDVATMAARRKKKKAKRAVDVNIDTDLDAMLADLQANPDSTDISSALKARSGPNAWAAPPPSANAGALPPRRGAAPISKASAFAEARGSQSASQSAAAAAFKHQVNSSQFATLDDVIDNLGDDDDADDTATPSVSGQKRAAATGNDDFDHGGGFDMDANFDGASNAENNDNASAQTDSTGADASTAAPKRKKLRGAPPSAKAKAAAASSDTSAASATEAKASKARQTKLQVDNSGHLPTPRDAAAESDAQRAANAPAMAPAASGGNFPWLQAADRKLASKDAAPGRLATGAMTLNGLRLGDLSLDKEGSLSMYWTDAAEEPFHLPGVAFLFGKVWVEKAQRFASCCLVVRDIPRQLFVVPRAYKLNEHGEASDEAPTIMEVYAEIDAMRKSLKITEFGAKPVEKMYAFERTDVPRGKSTFLEVSYSAKEPAFPENCSGRTFSHIFGVKTKPLEALLVQRRIMGPCWLRVRDMVDVDNRISHCRVELELNDMDKLSVLDGDVPPPPPLVVMSVTPRTVYNHQTKANEVVCLGVIVHNEVLVDEPTKEPVSGFESFAAVRPLQGKALPPQLKVRLQRHAMPLETCANERMLLNYFMSKMERYDPDVLVGHNFIGYSLDVLLHRMAANKVPNWSKLGRLKRTKMPKLQAGAGGQHDSTFQEKAVTSGRLVLDTYVVAKELLREKNYSLQWLVQSQLQKQRQEIDFDQTARFFYEGDDLLWFVNHAIEDASLTMQLQFQLQAIPLTKQLTTIAGNLWSRSLLSQRAERIAYLLLHEFHNLGYVLPDKEYRESKKGGARREKAKYAGGLVLEPKVGFYDNYVLLLDFNSLYPSIIQEHNVCFTTVEAVRAPDGDWEPAQPPPADVAEGVLPRVIKTLVDRRRTVKALLKKEKNEVRRSQYNIRQLSLKLIANSMYGCLGFTHSRFYAQPLAELITRKGRETLQMTVDLAQNQQHLDVIYGDTDSIMIHTGKRDVKEVLQIGKAVKQEVNKMFSKLEIEIDGIFKTMLLLKKKKYAALTLLPPYTDDTKTDMETKGLDLVRRDWCDLSRKMGEYVLEQILSGRARDEVVTAIHQYLAEQAARIKANEVPMVEYVITKSLSKLPEEYPDSKSLPHVQVALKMTAQRHRVGVGDHIPYVICKGEGNFAARAYHPDEVMKAKGALELDTDWYLKQQIHPPISRLCEPIDGTDAVQVAHFLGLDTEKFRAQQEAARQRRNAEQEAESTVGLDLAEKFADCAPLPVPCAACGEVNSFAAVQDTLSFDEKALARGEPDNEGVDPAMVWEPRSGLVCRNKQCGAHLSDLDVYNALTHVVRAVQRRHYEGWMCCDERACPHHSKPTRHCHYVDTQHGVEARCNMPQCDGRMQLDYDARRLLVQLEYYKYLFDVSDEAIKRRVRADAVNDFIRKLDRKDSDGMSDRAALRYLGERVDAVLAQNSLYNIDGRELWTF